MRHLLYERQKKQHGGDRKSSGQIEHLKTAEKVASLTGVGEKTVRRAAEFAKMTPLTPPGDIAVTNLQSRKPLILLGFSMPKAKMSL